MTLAPPSRSAPLWPPPPSVPSTKSLPGAGARSSTVSRSNTGSWYSPPSPETGRRRVTSSGASFPHPPAMKTAAGASSTAAFVCSIIVLPDADHFSDFLVSVRRRRRRLRVAPGVPDFKTPVDAVHHHLAAQPHVAAILLGQQEPPLAVQHAVPRLAIKIAQEDARLGSGNLRVGVHVIAGCVEFIRRHHDQKTVAELRHDKELIELVLAGFPPRGRDRDAILVIESMEIFPRESDRLDWRLGRHRRW